MSQISEVKQRTLESVEYLLSVPRDRFNPIGPQVQPLPGYDAEKITNLVTTFLDFCEKLAKSINVYENLPLNVPESLDGTLSSISSDIRSNITLDTTSFTAQHHNLQNNMNSFISMMYSYGLVSTLANVVDTNEVARKKSNVIIQNVLGSEAILTEAIVKANEFITLNRAVYDVEITELQNTYEKLANDYSKPYTAKYISWLNPYYTYLLVSLFLIGCVWYYNVYHFDYWENGWALNVDLYQFLLLKVLSVSIPLGIAFYLLSEFLHFRKMREFYEIKSSSLKTMRGLLKTYSDPQDREIIIRSASNRIFSDFSHSKKGEISEASLLKMLDFLKK